MRTGSFQSSCTSRTFGLAATTASTSRAISRTFCVSGPTMRNCTGKPTGGPSSSRVTRTHTPGNCSFDGPHQPRAHAFAGLHVLRHHDEDGVARVRQLRIERQIEARLAGAGVRGVELDVLVLREHRLHLLDLLGRRRERRAFLQSQLDDELGPRAVGEELLWHEPASRDRSAERGHGDTDHPPAPLDREVDPAAQPAVERRVVRVAAMVVLLEVRQHLHGEVRRDETRDDPREHDGGTDDPEDAARVLAGGRLREADRHERGGR